MSRRDTDGLDGIEGKNDVYTFGEYLRKLRNSHGFSLKVGAKRMGIPEQKLCDIESGRRYHKRISMELIQRVSEAYDIPVSDIFTKVQTVLHISQSTEQVMMEMIPLIRLTELEAEQLSELAATYPKEVEDLAKRVHINLKKIKVLSRLVQNRNVDLG